MISDSMLIVGKNKTSWVASTAEGEQGEGGDSAALHSTGETPPAELHPVLDLLYRVQRRVTKMIRGWKQAETVGIVQPRKRRLWGDLIASFQYL